MATERLTPRAVYLLDHVAQTQQQISDASATIQTAGSYTYNGSNVPSTMQSLFFDFGISSDARMGTMQVSVAAPYFYTLTKSASGSGQLKSGYFEANAGTESGGINNYAASKCAFRRQSYPDSNSRAVFSNFGANAYSDYNGSSYLGSRPYGIDLHVLPYAVGDIYSNVAYTYSGSLQVALTGNAPYVDVTWSDIVPVISDRTPAAGAFVNEKAANVFRWKFSAGSTANGTATTQNGGALLWRESESGTVHEIAFSGTADSVTVPANTFPASGTSVQWALRVTTCWGYTATTDWITLSTVDATPSAPTALQPASTAVDNNAAVTFSWAHTISTGTAQSAAELQYSTDGSSWTTFATVSGGTQNCSVPANTLPAGTDYWHARTSNSDGVAGPWSDAVSIVVRSSPKPATISAITATPRPTVSWQQTEQVGYRVVFAQAGSTVYDTGEQYGTAKAVKCQNYCAAGEVSVTVQVANAIGLWSSVSSTVVVSNPLQAAIVLAARSGYDAVTLSWSSDYAYTAYYVLRDGVPIARTTGTSYADKAAAGKAVYTVMGVYGDGADYYTVSGSVTAIMTMRSVIIHDVDADGACIHLVAHRDSPPVRKIDVSGRVEYQHFAGKQLPDAYDSGFRDETISLEYTVRHTELPALKELVGKTLCVRTATGERYYAVLDSLSQNTWKREDVTLALTRVDYTEAVAYE